MEIVDVMLHSHSFRSSVRFSVVFLKPKIHTKYRWSHHSRPGGSTHVDVTNISDFPSISGYIWIKNDTRYAYSYNLNIQRGRKASIEL